jgi:peptide/nickel transport system substrate-binding protein
MEELDYWKRLARRRLARRRFLTGAAAMGAGLAAVSVVGCGGGGEENGPTGTAVSTPAPRPSPEGAEPFATLPTIGPRGPWQPAKTRGGIARWFGFDALPLDTFDPHQTQFGPIYGMHSGVFSKVLMYDDIYDNRIITDLAETMPEVVDELTYVVKLRSNVRFHDTEKIRKNFPNTAGRTLTAEDVKYSIERQINKESPKYAIYYRASQWETLDKIELPDGPDGLTIKFTTKRPTAPFVHYLADTNAFIIARELVDAESDDINSQDKMVGTGPFLLDKFVALQVVRMARNPDWFAKDDLVDQGLTDRPILDDLESLWPPQDDTATEAAFRSKQVDYTNYVDSDNVARIAGEVGAESDRAITAGWVNTRMLLSDSERAKAPFPDLRLRKALHLAIDRSRMGQQMFGTGYFVLCPPISLALKQWAYTPEELIKKPGYRFGRQERQEDLAEAKQLWEAGGGPALPEAEIYVAGIPDYVKNFAPQLQRNLQETLGYSIKVRIDPTGYTELAQCALRKSCQAGLNYDNGWIDPDDWLYAYFHSTAPKNSFNLADPTLDRMLDNQRAEFDMDKRRQLVLEIQDYLLDNVLARLDWVAPAQPSNRWPYLGNRRMTPWFGDWYLYPPNLWIDSTHPTYQGRPA